MRSDIWKYGVLSALLLAPIGAHAQGVVGGAAKGADQGAAKGADQGSAAAGPVGAVVGGVAGAVAGGVGGLLGADQRPRFHDYVVRERHPSYRYHEDLRVGLILPAEGVQYYDVPPEYGVRGGSYTVINDHAVLVDPRTHQVVQIVD